jgi:hypothetical protein
MYFATKPPKRCTVSATERAVRAGLELIDAVAGLKSSAPLEARVGVATGMVVVGDLIGKGSAQEQAVVGADSAVAFAEYLNAADVPVNLLVTYEPTRFADDVPPNVERYINLYQSDSILGGGDVVQDRRFHGHYASFNLKDHREIIHINLDKFDRIQEQLVGKIRALAATPASAEGEAVPLRIDVPAPASIELWDSGLAVSAHAGDTLQTLAATHHVPLWALAQVNQKSEQAALTKGERIIVPRYLVPRAAPRPVSSYASTGR